MLPLANTFQNLLRTGAQSVEEEMQRHEDPSKGQDNLVRVMLPRSPGCDRAGP